MATKRSASRKLGEAMAMLKADHDKVKKMFKEFEKLHEDEADEEAQQLATQICNELKIHTALEEEIFYPEVRNAIEDEDLMNEAEVEHASAKQLIEQIEGMDASDEKWAAKVTVLGEYVNHHIKEEQDEMFPEVRKAKLDEQDLAERMMERKQELMSQMGMSEDQEQEGEEGESSSGRGGKSSSGSGRAQNARR
jgi:hypothetical protein